MKTVTISRDGPALRFYILSVFALLQGLKAYDFLALRAVSDPQLAQFLVKWSIFDTCFVYLLPYLQIPWLRFRRSLVLLQILGVLGLNWGLSFGWEIWRDSGFGVGILWTALFKGMADGLLLSDYSVL
jgi:hypothetical protein